MDETELEKTLETLGLLKTPEDKDFFQKYISSEDYKNLIGTLYGEDFDILIEKVQNIFQFREFEIFDSVRTPTQPIFKFRQHRKKFFIITMPFDPPTFKIYSKNLERNWQVFINMRRIHK